MARSDVCDFLFNIGFHRLSVVVEFVDSAALVVKLAGVDVFVVRSASCALLDFVHSEVPPVLTTSYSGFNFGGLAVVWSALENGFHVVSLMVMVIPAVSFLSPCLMSGPISRLLSSSSTSP